MTKTIKLALVAAMAMGATSAFATNGDNLIGYGAKSRAMGGTGIAHYNGAETATSNPALITKGDGTDFTFGGTYFRPDVSVKTTMGGSGYGLANPLTGGNAQQADSDAKHNVIPYVALTENFDNGFAVGASMYGSAGMGTDYRNSAPASTAFGGNGLPNLYSMRTNLLLLKFSVPLAYGQDNWSIGIAPVLMYGALDLSFDAPSPLLPAGTYGDVGNGSSSSFGLGIEVGAAYTLPDLGITLGATYHSKVSMEYKDQMSTSSAAFGYGSNPMALQKFSDKLDQPAEYGLGIDWTEGDISITADYKNIRWNDAEGYQQFGWENQDVYALGAEYRMDDLSIRIGYNYAKNPITNSKDATSITGFGGATNGDLMNAFNAVMFPAITDRHYTIGAGYQFTKSVAVDVALTYAQSSNTKYSAQSIGLGEIEVVNDQIAASANLNYSF